MMIEATAAAKVIGVVGGTFLALVFIPPASVREFMQRLGVAVVFGLLFGPIVAWYFELPETLEHIAAGFAGAAFASWWALGAIKVAAEKVGIKSKRSADKADD